MEKRIIHITAGRGPVECMLAVSKMLKWLLKSAQKDGLETEIIDKEPGTERNTFASVSILIKGEEAINFSRKHRGVVLWICSSPFRKNHKRKNWFIEIYSYEQGENATLSPEDVVFETKRSSGPGGQHVNKTESAVRATHKKSGLNVNIQQSRSQLQNKKIAIEKLYRSFAQNQVRKIKEENQHQWKQSINVKRGSPKYTFTGIDFNLKKKN